MNTKIRRIEADIERSEKRIAELTDHIKDLKTRKLIAENEEIVKRVREASKQGASLEEVVSMLNDPAPAASTPTPTEEEAYDEEDVY